LSNIKSGVIFVMSSIYSKLSEDEVKLAQEEEDSYQVFLVVTTKE